jgi:glutaconate CoA-transferase, subunit A
MSKVCSLPEAVSAVGDGAHLALTGFSITRSAVAAAAELVRAGRRGLTLSQVTGSMDTDMLVGSGCVDRLVYSGGSLDRFGNLYSVNRAIAAGMPCEEYSTLTLALRMLAGSLGLPFLPTRALIGSQLLDHLIPAGGAMMISDPFTGTPALALAPVRPDVAIVHANVCDEDGNASVQGPLWSIKETALASATVIVTAERVVARGEIDPSTVLIPGTVVTAVAEVPGGGQPTAVYGAYDYDADMLTGYAAASRAGGDDFHTFVADRLLARMVTR